MMMSKQRSPYAFLYGIKGTYKGVLFRSILEYSFMKHMESQGRVLTETLQYETIRVKYEHENKTHTYTVDFYDVVTKTAYEIKHSYNVKKKLPANEVKWAAASNKLMSEGIGFVLMTEKDYPVLTVADAFADPDVILKEPKEVA